MKKKRHIGVFLHMKPADGGSFQYEAFILDALDACKDEYLTTVVYDSSDWDEVLSSLYPTFSRKKIQFNYDSMYRNVDALELDYLFVPSYGPNHFFEVRFQTPLISVFHDFMYYYEPEGKMWDDKNFSYLLQAICFRSAGIFVDSDLGKQHCLNVLGHMYEDKVVPLPFRVPDYLLEEKDENIKLRWDKYFFYPAQLWPIKNQLNIVLAMDMLRENGIFVNFVFTGANSGIYEYLVHLIRTLGLEKQIEILDYASGSAMKYLFQHARAMVMPSYAGPTNIPPLEAMACGCPVAVSDIYAMPWQVGEAGLRFDPKSVEDIADTLKKLWEDDELCQKLSLQGRERIKFFSRDAFQRRFREGMRHIISSYENRYINLDKLVRKCKVHAKVFLYGAGTFGALICNYLCAHNVMIDGFIVTSQSESSSEWYGHPVYSLNTIKENLFDALVIISVYQTKHLEIAENIKGVPTKELYFVTGKDWVEAYTYYTMKS